MRIKIKKHCFICGKVFYGREIARYCSCKCRKKAQRSKSQMPDKLYDPSVTLSCIEIPSVYRFVIRNCDFCARLFGVPPCPAPYSNIYEMTYNELPNSFLDILNKGKCNYFVKKNEHIENSSIPTSNPSTPTYFFDEYNQILYLFLNRNQLDWLSKIDELENELKINSKKNLVFIRGGVL